MIYIATKKEIVPVLKSGENEPITEVDILSEVENKTKIFNAHFKTNYPTPRVIFDTFGSRYGFYRKNTREIYVHRDLLKLGNTALNTAIHELSHYIAYKYYGNSIKPHGREWKFIMQFFGKSPRRITRRLIGTQLKGFQKRYIVVCPNCNTIRQITERILKTLSQRICHCGYSMEKLTYTPILVK